MKKRFEKIINDASRKRELLEKVVWRASDVASFLGVSEKYVYQIAGRDLPVRKKGRLRFFLPEEVLNWIEEG